MLVLGLVGFGAISARTQNAPQNQPQDLIVRSLAVVDAKGQERILLNVHNGSGSIEVHSAKVQRIVRIGSNEDGGDIVVKNNRNKFAAMVSSEESGDSVSVYGDVNESQPSSFPAAAILGDSKGGAILVYDKESKVVFQAPAK